MSKPLRGKKGREKEKRRKIMAKVGKWKKMRYIRRKERKK